MGLGGWRHSKAGKVYALHVVSPDSVSNIPYGLSELAGIITVEPGVNPEYH